MATPTTAQQKAIADLYIALFNRAPDADGFNFWTQALADGASLTTIAQNFVTTPEARTVYPETQTAEQFVSAYYSSVLGRPIDASGLAFWTQLLQQAGGVESVAARAMVVSQIVEIVNTPLPVKPADITDEAYALTFADRNAFKNKGEVAIYYAVEYKGNDLNLAKQVLAVVGPTVGTIDIAKGLLNPSTGGGTPPAPAVPLHFTGTVDADDFVGGAADDTFDFVIDNVVTSNTTLTTGDNVDGGAGNDTMTVTTTGLVEAADFAKATVTGVETVVIKRVSGSSVTYDATEGVKSVIVQAGAGAFRVNNLGAGADVELNAVTGGTMTIAYQPEATSTTLTLSGGVNTGNVLYSSAGLTAITIKSTGSANMVDRFFGSPQVKTLNIVADTAFSTNYIQASSMGAVVNISGAGAVNVGSLSDPSIEKVDAAANTGGLTATLDANNPVVVITGSAGNDTIFTGVELTRGFVDAGAGTGDRLVVTDSVALATADLGGKYTGFDILRVNNGVTVDLANIAGITSVELDAAAGATGVTNLTAAQAAAVTILGATTPGVITIGVKDATDAGQSDTVKAALTTTGSQPINLTGLTLTGIEKLELTGNGVATATTGTVILTTANATALDSIVVKNAGGAIITVASEHAAINLSIDASQSAGNVVIDASAYDTGTGATIKGGVNGSVLMGSKGTDILIGGAGDDILIGDGWIRNGTKEVQTIALTGSAVNEGTYHLGNYSIEVTGNQDAKDVAAVITGADKAAFLLANPTVENITYSDTDEMFTITYKAAVGNVPLIVSSVSGAAQFDPAVAFEVTRGTGGLMATVARSADTLTGGEGRDIFMFAEGSSSVAAYDTITDLNLGNAVASGRVDTLVFQNRNGVARIVTLSDADQTAVADEATLADAANAVLALASDNGDTAMFTYKDDTYVVHNGDGDVVFNNRSDFLVKVTGVTGTLDASDIVLLAGILPN